MIASTTRMASVFATAAAHGANVVRGAGRGLGCLHENAAYTAGSASSACFDLLGVDDCRRIGTVITMASSP